MPDGRHPNNLRNKLPERQTVYVPWFFHAARQPLMASNLLAMASNLVAMALPGGPCRRVPAPLRPSRALGRSSYQGRVRKMRSLTELAEEEVRSMFLESDHDMPSDCCELLRSARC